MQTRQDHSQVPTVNLESWRKKLEPEGKLGVKNESWPFENKV